MSGDAFPCILYTPMGGPALLGEIRTIGEELGGYWTVYIHDRPYWASEDYIRLFDTPEQARREWLADRKLERAEWRH